jgi:hypothetical protein
VFAADLLDDLRQPDDTRYFQEASPFYSPAESLAQVGLVSEIRSRQSFLFRFDIRSTQVIRDFAELFQGGFEVIDDFLGENVGIGEIVGDFEAFVSEPEDVEAGLVAVA